MGGKVGEMKSFDDFLKQLQNEYNGCPWLNKESELYRERGEWDDISGQDIIIEDVYAISDYHAVILKDNPNVYLSSGGLKDMLNKYAIEYGRYIRNIVFRVGEKREFKTSDGERREYRPLTIVGKVTV